MSTLTNEQLVADLGWCIQIIHDSTGGRVPAFWRPPYGDSDNRVRAIAKEIFGLTTVIWNFDSDDWNIGNQGITLDTVEAKMQTLLTGPKSPGINVLEHEISPDDVTNFIYAYPLMKANNWTVKSIPEIVGKPWYQNSLNNVSPVTPMDQFAQYPPKNMSLSSTTAPTTTSSATEATSTTAVASAPNSNLKAGSSIPTSTPRLWNVLMFLTLTLGAYFL